MTTVFTASGKGVNFIVPVRRKGLSLERRRLDMVHLDLARQVNSLQASRCQIPGSLKGAGGREQAI
jgi:hypothetical protein